MGFCRTNLFKRLESSGEAFEQSVERHVLRNYVFLHAIENNLPLPLGTQDAVLLDSGDTDGDADDQNADAQGLLEEQNDEDATQEAHRLALRDEAAFRKLAAITYDIYRDQKKKRFKWLRPDLFVDQLKKDLISDSARLLKVLNDGGEWDHAKDNKLTALIELLTKTHPKQKVLIFSQFADTVRYLERRLRGAGVKTLGAVTGQTTDPTNYVWRFSPVSNNKRDKVATADELRVLVVTDVLSEGQNLQDAAILVNYDLPWAIIRLIQRAGRVDRIGQKANQILCYSFLPADGVERLIRLRSRVRQRLKENGEVVGTDEAFFEDEGEREGLQGLYDEKSGLLDGEADNEVDLASYAFQIWKNAIDANPALQKTIPALPSVVYSTKAYTPTPTRPEGALVYLRTAQGNDALAWVDKTGASLTQSQFEILKAAACEPDTPVLARQEEHHEMVAKGVEHIATEEKQVGGQLGHTKGPRRRTYERLKRHAERQKGTLFDHPDLHKAIEDIYRFPLRQTATDTLNRQLKSGIEDEKLADLVLALREEDRLCLIQEEEHSGEPQIICSLGLARLTA